MPNYDVIGDVIIMAAFGSSQCSMQTTNLQILNAGMLNDLILLIYFRPTALLG